MSGTPIGYWKYPFVCGTCLRRTYPAKVYHPFIPPAGIGYLPGLYGVIYCPCSDHARSVPLTDRLYSLDEPPPLDPESWFRRTWDTFWRYRSNSNPRWFRLVRECGLEEATRRFRCGPKDAL